MYRLVTRTLLKRQQPYKFISQSYSSLRRVRPAGNKPHIPFKPLKYLPLCLYRSAQ